MGNVKDLRWGNDLRQSGEYGNFMESLGWKVIEIPSKKDSLRVFVKHIGPLKIAKTRRPGPWTDWPIVLNRMKREKVLLFQIDPEMDNPEEFKRLGFSKKREQILGTKTLLIDLRPGDEEIFKSFKPETRTKLRKIQDSGFKIEINEFDSFYDILREGYKDLDVWCPPKDQYDSLISVFGNKCFCLSVNGVSGCLVLIHNGVAEYYYAASKKEGKAHNLPYAVVWEAIKEARKRGAQVWDFNGYFDERYPDTRWKGFSFFKSRFGGKLMEFAGTYTKWIFPWNR